jgi:electron transfer flavoprotein alpha subunit
MILLIAEHANGSLRKSALELVTVARDLASKFGLEVVAAVLGSGLQVVTAELAGYVSRVVAVDQPALANFRAEPYTTVVTALAKDLSARVVLLSASRSGLSYSPRVAVRLDAALLEDVTMLEPQDGLLVAKRFSYLSRVTETVKANTFPVIVSVKPNMFPVSGAGVAGSVETKTVTLSSQDERVAVGEKAAAKLGRVALEEASIVVTGGRGVGGPEGFSTLVEPLADALNAGVGATRAVVDAGWRPYSEQVGQTGKTVAPDLYIALGVSGAVQHLSGMNRSKLIVAINKDSDAPIFKVADYGVVGDVKAVVPALEQVIKTVKG